jgi:hypothetical protein
MRQQQTSPTAPTSPCRLASRSLQSDGDRTVLGQNIYGELGDGTTSISGSGPVAVKW